MEQNQFVTLLSSENYIDGVLCLNESLHNVRSCSHLKCLVTSDIANASIPLLKFFNIDYEIVDRLHYRGIDDKRLSNTASKIAIYNMDENFPMIYIDCDTYFLRCADELFSMPVGSATIVSDGDGTYKAMSSLFSFVPYKKTYQLLKSMVQTVPGIMDGDIIMVTYNENIQNKSMIMPYEKYNWPIDPDGKFLIDNKDVSIIHFILSHTKPWQMSDEEFDRHWGKHECMKQYKKCLDAVREKKNKLKKLIETSKLLIDQEIGNINKSLGI